MKASLVIFLVNLLLLQMPAHAQTGGIRGRVTDESGNSVPFTSIGVEKASLGSMANEEGEYRLPLSPGEYTIYFQCLGFKTEKRDIKVDQGFSEWNVTLTEQLLQTKEVLIAPNNEDPAYAIMRKAIARASINRLLIDAYTAEVYVRGGGKFLDVPFLIRPLLKKEGIDPNTVFFKETLESLEFRQPNTYIEKVLASRSNFGKMEIRQNFLKYELYSPRFGQTVSPLAPSAFRYYRFQYLGAFTDQKHEVYKIRVIPRSEGQHIWEGEISIVDGLWCLHSVSLCENGNGFDICLRQEYNPVEGIWLPSHIRQDVKGKVIGVSAEFVYNASVRKYRIKKNEKLYADYKKLEQKLDQETDEIIRADPQKPDLKKQEKEDRKMLRQLAKTYLKEKIRARKKENKDNRTPASVVSNRIFIEDSSSVRKDSAFWAENRLVPLTEAEVRSYRKMDSIYSVQAKKDSVKKGGRQLEVLSEVLLKGRQFSFGKADSLRRKPMELKVFSPLENLGFNAVEGYVLEQRIWLKKYFGQSRSRFTDQRPYLQFGPDFRYSFGRKRWLCSGLLQYGRPKWTIQLAGGSGIRQYAEKEPISPNLNFIYALYGEKNYMKLYQSDYLKLNLLRKLSGRLELESGFEFSDRSRLSNASLQRMNGKALVFETNQSGIPAGPGFQAGNPGRLAEFRLGLEWYPFMVSALFNERQVFRLGNGPAIHLGFRKAIPGIFGSRADFSCIDLGWRQSVGLWKTTRLEFSARAAAFTGKRFVAPMDGLHVLGNQTVFISSQNLEQFRNLPYYSWTNSSRLAEFHTQLYSEKLVFGWIFPERKKWRELLFFNLLGVPDKPYFREVGIGVDRLFQILHLNLAVSQAGNDKPQWAFLLGTSYFFPVRQKSYDKSPAVGAGGG